MNIGYVRSVVPSPLGDLTLVASGGVLAGVFFQDHSRPPVLPGLTTVAALAAVQTDDADPALAAAARVLQRYFSGDLTHSGVQASAAGTAFQRAVWAALTAIPAGQTVTYAQVAVAIGRPSAVRAVGAAVGANPLSIVVPCHRVVGAGGALTGFAGGLERKTWLLRHEGALASSRSVRQD